MRILGLAGLHRAGLAAMLLLALSGCMSQHFFIDGSLKNVSVAQIERLDRPRPVQLLFAYRIRGLVDPLVSDLLEQDVQRIVSSSGLFTAVDAGPAPGGAIVNITIERFPDTDNEVSKGLASGLTIGVVGYTRSDPFVCTVNYVPAPGVQKLTTEANHAIHMPLGLISSRPKDLVLADSWRGALRTVTRQSVTASLKQLSHSPDFRKEAQAP
jgi:hypothetical protein